MENVLVVVILIILGVIAIGAGIYLLCDEESSGALAILFGICIIGFALYGHIGKVNSINNFEKDIKQVQGYIDESLNKASQTGLITETEIALLKQKIKDLGDYEVEIETNKDKIEKGNELFISISIKTLNSNDNDFREGWTSTIKVE